MSQIPRKLTYKIYNRSGTFVKVLDDVLNTPEFEYSVNGGLGEVVLKLNRKIDDYGEGNDLDLNYRLKIYLNDPDNTDKLLYTGYLTAFNPYVKGGDEGVEITFLPNISKLKNDYWRSSTNVLTGFAVQESATELGQIMENIIDNYRTLGETDLIISNDYANVDDTSETLTYLFKDIKHLDAIKKVAEFLPTNWYWYVNPEGKLYLKAKSASSTHKFILRKHIKELETHKNIESVINHFFIWSGKGSASLNYVDKSYTDTNSVGNFGTISDLKIDSDIHTTAYADLIGTPEIAENKDPKRRITIVLGSEYDLASINPGDTCKVMDIDENQTLFGTNMSVVRILYKVDSAILELTEFSTNLSELTSETENAIERAIDALQRDFSLEITPDQLVLGSRDWVTDLVFSSTDYNTVSWAGGGSIKVATSSASAPTTYSITAGNTGDMASTTVIYFQPSASTNSLQKSTTFSDAMGSDRIGLCYAIPATAPKGATVVNIKPGIGMVIDGANIAAKTILAEQIAANVITADEINTGAINISVWAGDTSDLSEEADHKFVTGNEKTGADRAHKDIDASGNFIGAIDPAHVAPTGGGAGLYLGSDYLGYYSGSTWKAYINSSGDFYFSGADASNRIDWNITTPNTLTIRGSLTADDITVGTITARKYRTATEGTERIEINAAGYINEISFFNASNVWTHGIYTSGGELRIGVAPAGSGSAIEMGTNLELITTGDMTFYGDDFFPSTVTQGSDLGTSTYKWQHLYLYGNIVVDGTVDGVDISVHAAATNAHHHPLSNGYAITPGTVSTQYVYIAGGTHKVYGPYTSIIFDTSQTSSGGMTITPGIDGLLVSGNQTITGKLTLGSLEAYAAGTIVLDNHLRPISVVAQINLGNPTIYFNEMYSNTFRYKVAPSSFQHHDDIQLLKNIKETEIKEPKTKRKMKVWDLGNLPEEVRTKEGFIDQPKLQGFIIGTLKQLIEKVEMLEAKVQ